MGNALALSWGGRLSLPQSNCSFEQVSACLRLPRVMKMQQVWWSQNLGLSLSHGLTTQLSSDPIYVSEK